MPSREARLHDAIAYALPKLADVTAALRSEGPIDRDELADVVTAAASRLISDRNQPTTGGRPYLSQRCVCGHVRGVHSEHVDPAEPCTAGWDDGQPCSCTRFERANG